MRAFGPLAASVWVGAALGSIPSAAWSQQDTTVVTDTVAVDSVGPRVVRLPVPPPAVALGPAAPGSRYVFDRDSMLWTSAITVADLLTSIPGVYVARGGFLGQPEIVMFAGRGPASVEVFWDGMRYEPVGGDSVYVDLGRFTLTYLRRVEVDLLPASLRVHLVSERHEFLEPRSFIRLVSGAFSTAQYAGVFGKRWPSGVGLHLAGDFVGSDGAPGVDRSDSYLDLWARVEWLPNRRSGATYQMRRQRFDRELYATEGGLGVPRRDGRRTDFIFHLFTGTRDDGLGLRAGFGLASTAWTGDSTVPDRTVRQAFATFGYARPNFNVEVTARAADGRFDESVAGRIGWVPMRGVVLSGSGRIQRLTGGRTAHRGVATLGLYGGPLFLTGAVATGSTVQAPAIVADTAQTTTDASVQLGFRSRRLTAQAGLARREAYVPLAPPDFRDIAAFDSTPHATYLTADAALRVVDPLTVSASYSDPRPTTAPTVGSALQPPRHGRFAVTFRSKFWRTFRSGIFDLMLRYSVEYWGNGTAGLDGAGTPIVLPAANFQEAFIQIQLVDFRLFWNLRNATNTTAQFVPGLVYPRNAQTFGVRWEFRN